MKTTIVWILRILALGAILVGGLVFAYEMGWLANCGVHGVNQIRWKAECLPYLFGDFGWEIGHLTEEVMEWFWYKGMFREASVAIFLAGVYTLTLSFLEWLKYPRQNIASMILWPIFPLAAKAMTPFEVRMNSKFAIAGAIMTITTIAMFLVR